MSFQWIINNAESISMNRQEVVAATTARDGTVRSVGRGNAPWRIEVKLPDGPRWTDLRQNISAAEKFGRGNYASIQFNTSGHSWIVGYQGNSVNYTGFAASWVAGNNYITLTSSPTTSSGYKFRAGDFIQLGSGSVYTVSTDVAYNSNTVYLNRVVIDVSASGSLKVAENCIFKVICTQFPTWTLFARDQVSWSGPFVFQEYIV